MCSLYKQNAGCIPSLYHVLIFDIQAISTSPANNFTPYKNVHLNYK